MIPNQDHDDLPYLIIGGGLAGLSLAQSLKAASIPFHVYEKDDHASFRAQGYRIRISAEGAAALQSLLPEDLFTEFENSCGAFEKGGHQLHAFTGEEVAWPAGIPQRGPRRDAAENGKSYNADRAVIRRVLLRGLDDYITFGNRLEKYELQGQGVTATFSDGSIVVGRMLIGADGVRSHVRTQMLPDFTVLDTEGRAIFGKTPITENLFSRIPPQVGECICLTSDPDAAKGSVRLFSDIMKFDRTQGCTIELPADYIYWVLVFHRNATDMSDRDLLSLSCGEAAGKASDLVKDWHGSVRTIVEEQDPTAAAALAFLAADPKTGPWKPDVRVTVVGDAAHPCPPVGGLGANGAFEDVSSLSSVIRSGMTLDALGRYEEEMRSRAKSLIAKSAGGSGHFFGMKPLEELEPERIWT